MGTTLTGVESQTLGYRRSYPGELPMFQVDGVLPFGYESTGVETRFTCGLDPVPTSRRVFSFHQRLERIDAEVDYDAAELDRRVVATGQIRTVAAALRDSLPVMFPDRERRADGLLANVPKTLIFAKDDSHADDIVQTVREEFGLGNEAAVKITYRSGDSGHCPDELLARFRNSYNPRIAVTVDLIATGTDVKPIECVVFMRRVRSRNYFEQMKGRGVRVIDPDDLRAVTPDATVKDRFVLVDAVGVTDDDLHDTAPLERNRHESLDKLLSRIGLGSTEEAVVSSVASRLARLDQRITAGDRAEVEKIAGMSLSALAHRLVEALDPDRHVQAAAEAAGTDDPTVEQVAAAREQIVRDALQPLAGNPELREKLIDVRRSYEQMIDSASVDKVITGEFSVDATDRARRQTESFREFIDDNRDQITALQVLYDQPRRGGLTYGDIKELANAIAHPPHRWTTDLAPGGAADFAAAARGEDEEREGEFGAGPGAGGSHGRERVCVAECSVVLDLVAVAGQRPHHCCGGVVGSVAFGDGPRHDGADAVFEFPCGLPAALPDRPDDGEHVLGGDLGDGHVAEARVGEPAEGGPPAVRGPPAVLPGRLVHRDHLLARLGEARRGGVVTQSCRVATLAGEFAVLEAVWRASAREVYG